MPTKRNKNLNQQQKLERLLLSQGHPRSTWESWIAQMSDAIQKEFAACVDDDGMVQRGSRTKFVAWQITRRKAIGSRPSAISQQPTADSRQPKAPPPVRDPIAKETGEHADG